MEDRSIGSAYTPSVARSSPRARRGSREPAPGSGRAGTRKVVILQRRTFRDDRQYLPKNQSSTSRYRQFLHHGARHRPLSRRRFAHPPWTPPTSPSPPSSRRTAGFTNAALAARVASRSSTCTGRLQALRESGVITRFRAGRGPGSACRCRRSSACGSAANRDQVQSFHAILRGPGRARDLPRGGEDDYLIHGGRVRGRPARPGARKHVTVHQPSGTPRRSWSRGDPRRRRAELRNTCAVALSTPHAAG